MTNQPAPPHPDQQRPALPSAVVPVAWRTALPALGLALVLILVLYRETAIAMVTIWHRSETFAHAFVVPPIVLWLIWRKREHLATLVPKPAAWVLLPMAGAAILWLLGDMVAVNSVTQLAFTALLVLAVPALLGIQVARAITFPLVFLFFAVPIGEFMLPQLMEWTATFTIMALRLSGLAVHREGLQFVISSGSWSVVEACSGVRYLLASVTVGTLYAYLNYQSTKRRALFILVSILVPIVANWMRAYMIVMVGHFSGNTLAVGVDHLVYGWVFFGIVIMLMFLIGARWSEPDQPAVAVAPPAPSRTMTTVTPRFWAASAVLALVVALPAMVQRSIESKASSIAPVLAAPAQLAGGWSLSDTRTLDFKPAFENPSGETNSAYSAAGQVVGLYLGYYENQDYRRKLVSSSNALVVSDDPGWSRVGSGQLQVKAGEQMVSVRTAELRNLREVDPATAGRLVAWQIYWIDGTLTASDYLAKAYSALHRLTGRGDHSAVIIVYAAQDPGKAGSAALASFLAANYTAIDAMLRQAARN